MREQKAITTLDSEPEPDCAVVVFDPDDYLVGHPTPPVIALVVEVADRSLALDRDLKARIYGRAEIPVYWIVNIPDRQVEVHTDPTGVTNPPEAAGYRSRQVYQDTDAVPTVIRGQVVAQVPVMNLLPRR